MNETDRLMAMAEEIGAQRRAAQPNGEALVRKPQRRTKESYRWLAQERRLARVSPETVREAMVSIGAPEYAQGVIEAMRHRGPACPLCHARPMHEWAYKSFERVARWVGIGDDVVDALTKALGVTSDVAKQAVGMYKSIQGLDRKAVIEQAKALLIEDGWTCLPPDSAVASVANGNVTGNANGSGLGQDTGEALA